MAYRDDLEAARMRRESLDRELRETRERIGEIDGLRKRERALEREIARTEVELDRTRARATRARLPGAPPASPCRMTWGLMRGGEFVRCCGRCGHRVFDISALAPGQAQRLLEDTSGRLHRRGDGTLLEGDCPAGRRKRRAVTWSTAAIIVLTGLLGTVKMTASPPRQASPAAAPEPPVSSPDEPEARGEPCPGEPYARRPHAEPARKNRYLDQLLLYATRLRPTPPSVGTPVPPVPRAHPARLRHRSRVRPPVDRARGPRVRPTRADLTRGIREVRSRVDACASLSGDRSVVRARVRVAPSGKVANVEVKPGGVDARTARCVTRAVRKAAFPATQQGSTFIYPFVLSP